jgi:hypothetical protein
MSFADFVASAIAAFCVTGSAPRRPPSRPWKTDGSTASYFCFVGSSFRSASYAALAWADMGKRSRWRTYPCFEILQHALLICELGLELSLPLGREGL